MVKDFNFLLPPELIASSPTTSRSDSKLMILNNNIIEHKKFINIVDYMQAGDCLVLNNTKVIKARLLGHKKTGAKIELLVERVVNNQTITAHIKKKGKLLIGTELILPNQLSATIIAQEDQIFHLSLNKEIDFYEYLEQYGLIPLPPYMKRKGDQADHSRYQTIYAKHQGSIAAPTAGLHFSKELLDQIIAKGIKVVYLTLHIGAGTFKPVKDIENHVMHKEKFFIDENTIKTIIQTKQTGGQVFCVGTTCVRSLETVAKNNFETLEGETDLFIKPGYSWSIPDCIITNFHLPKSSLIMLVSAFAGYKHIMSAYQLAIKNNYRFYSYGDAMLLYPQSSTPK